MSVVLETRSLVKRFGGITATSDVSLKVVRGARHALIGPNGAGKTTLINQLTGVLQPSAGSIWLDGDDITRVPAHRRVHRGLVRTFQINQLFAEMTPLRALALTVATRRGHSARWWAPLGHDADVADECEKLLAEFHLDDVATQRTALLPYGKRRLLEIAMAIACAPRVLLLDEPAAGVPEGERQEIFDSLARLPADVSVLLIEHDMDLVFSFAKQVTVLVNGAVFAEGDPATISNDPQVKAVYLGQGHGPGAEPPQAGPTPGATQGAPSVAPGGGRGTRPGGSHG
jgi:branched-chain amino acid transport system ATP-binding protein